MRHPTRRIQTAAAGSRPPTATLARVSEPRSSAELGNKRLALTVPGAAHPSRQQSRRAFGSGR